MKRLPLLLSAFALTVLAPARTAEAQETPPLPALPPSASSQPPPSPPALFAPPPEAVVSPRVPTVRVHVNVSRPVTLEVLSSVETRWQPVCVAPCDTEVPLEGVYRVVDHGMIPSGPLELEARPGDLVALDVTVRTLEQHRTAQRLTLTGYIAGAVGLGLEIGALAADPSSDAQPILLWTGVGAAAVAISCTITSYILGEQTSLSQSSASPPPGRATRDESPWLRAPVWAETERVRSVVPAVTNVPLFSTRF